jgi:hypothetical protein
MKYKKYKTFKNMQDEARKHHDYWLTHLELEIMGKVYRSRLLKDHWKHIGKIVDNAVDTISKMAEDEK